MTPKSQKYHYVDYDVSQHVLKLLQLNVLLHLGCLNVICEYQYHMNLFVNKKLSYRRDSEGRSHYAVQGSRSLILLPFESPYATSY